MKRLLERRFSMIETIALFVLAGVSVVTLVYAATTVPYTFTAGTTGKSSEVNANFQALQNGLNAFESAITVSGGNVGIGTTSPLRGLHLSGAGIKPVFVLENTTYTDPEGRWAIWVQDGPGNNGLRFHEYTGAGLTGGSDRLVIKTGGNVGIGTSSPAQRLHVEGVTRLSSGASVWDLTPTATTNNPLVIIDRVSNVRRGVFGTDGAVALGGPIGNDQGGGASVFINSSGNVGIGTTTPGAELEVASPTSPTIRIRGTSGENENLELYNGDTREWSIFNYGGDSSNRMTFSHSNGDVMTLTQSGNVGIGTTSPSAKLHVIGTAGNDTGVWSNLSDARLKQDIEPIHDALATIAQLQGVSFRWKDPQKDSQYGRVRGLVAQEVEEVLPEWVKVRSDGYRWLEPIGIDALLIEAIKEQQKEIEELKAALERLRRK